jgi:hypothetical protein
MKLKTLMLMARRRERLAADRRTRGDAFPMFTPREWADLPIYHPRTD